MGLLGDLVGSSAGELLEKTGTLVDDLVTTKEEKLRIKLELKTLVVEAQKEAAEQVTRRWEHDMKSDNELSKNIRPLTLVFLTAVFAVLSITDGNIGQFQLKEVYTDIYQALLMLVYGAYFAGRSIEKLNLGREAINKQLPAIEEGDFDDDDFMSRKERRRTRKSGK